MRPVNLLPASDRRATASGARQGSAYILVGVLSVLLLAVAVYALTARSVNSNRNEAAEAQTKADLAEARATTLSSFANFSAIRATRESSVRALSQSRLDWERLMRELSRVIPSNVKVTEINAQAQPAAGSAAAPAAAAAAAAAGAAGAAGPTMKLSGCAPTQPDVAVTIVRLRQLHDVQDVKLGQSAGSDLAVGAEGGAPGAGAAASGCPGPRPRTTGFSFDITVSFVPPAATPTDPADRKVPATLGGGA